MIAGLGGGREDVPGGEGFPAKAWPSGLLVWRPPLPGLLRHEPLQQRQLEHGAEQHGTALGMYCSAFRWSSPGWSDPLHVLFCVQSIVPCKVNLLHVLFRFQYIIECKVNHRIWNGAEKRGTTLRMPCSTFSSPSHTRPHILVYYSCTG